MATTSPLGHIPLPEISDRADGPTAFSNMAKKLEDITVIPYANSATRGQAYTAITPTRTPTAGTITYLIDQGAFEWWNGTAWIPILNPNLPKGIIQYATAGTEFPGPSGTMIPVATERMIPDMNITSVTLTAPRIYRFDLYVAFCDGGVGASPTTGGIQFALRYTSTTTAPVITSSYLAYSLATVTSDSTNTASTYNMTKIWSPPATGKYSFGISIKPIGTGGGRIYGSRNFSVEDIGTIKP